MHKLVLLGAASQGTARAFGASKTRFRAGFVFANKLVYGATLSGLSRRCEAEEPWQHSMF